MLRKIKIFLLLGSVILAITIAVILINKSISQKKATNTTPLIPNEQSQTISILTQSDTESAIKEKSAIFSKLPINIYGFNTSVGITTDIAISSYENDSLETIRVEIFGPNYVYNQNDPKTNPNMIAFAESFEKVKSVLKENNVNIEKTHISMGNKKYIRDIAEVWIKTLNLLP